jgi:hypothetical protein
MVEHIVLDCIENTILECYVSCETWKTFSSSKFFLDFSGRREIWQEKHGRVIYERNVKLIIPKTVV